MRELADAPGHSIRDDPSVQKPRHDMELHTRRPLIYDSQHRPRVRVREPAAPYCVSGCSAQGGGEDGRGVRDEGERGLWQAIARYYAYTFMGMGWNGTHATLTRLILFLSGHPRASPDTLSPLLAASVPKPHIHLNRKAGMHSTAQHSTAQHGARDGNDCNDRNGRTLLLRLPERRGTYKLV